MLVDLVLRGYLATLEQVTKCKDCGRDGRGSGKHDA